MSKVSVSWHRSSGTAVVVEIKAEGLSTLHRYFTTEHGAKACASQWAFLDGLDVPATERCSCGCHNAAPSNVGRAEGHVRGA